MEALGDAVTPFRSDSRPGWLSRQGLAIVEATTAS
jgi:hypothetical protein